MYYFLFDARGNQGSADGIEGYAVVWVKSRLYRQALAAARVFVGSQGLVMGIVRVAHRPTPAELERMTLSELAARHRGLRDDAWGYFVEWPSEDPVPEQGIRVRLLARKEGIPGPIPRISRSEKEHRPVAPV